MLNLSVFRILHLHKRSLTNWAVLLLREVPIEQTATSVQLQYFTQYASMNVMGKSTVRFVQYINILRQWHHMKEQYTDQWKNTASPGSVLKKNSIQKLFHGWCMFLIKQEHHQHKITDVGVKKNTMRSSLPIISMFSMCAQNPAVCLGWGMSYRVAHKMSYHWLYI